MILLIDNYDSFTYNLVQYFRQIEDNVVLYRNDKVFIEKVKALNPTLIVLSPGPGSPLNSGICREIIHTFHNQIPILGVCLGHQIIAEYFGATVKEGTLPVHGKVSEIRHDNKKEYAAIPCPTMVTRYHSLKVDRNSLPESLVISAEIDDGTIMGIRHRYLPVFGMQFHPEAILTTNGFSMLSTIYQIARKYRSGKSTNETVSTV